MEDLAFLLAKLFHNLENDISELYKRFNSYVLELLREKNIDLSLQIPHGDYKAIKDAIEKILQTINLAFMTIDYPKTRLISKSNLLKENLIDTINNFPDYSTFFNTKLTGYINNLLVEVLLEYLFIGEYFAIKKLELYDLIPREFIKHLDKFEKEHLVSIKMNATFKEKGSIFLNNLDSLNSTSDMFSMKTNKTLSEIKINSEKHISPKEDTNSQKISLELKQPRQKLDNKYKPYLNQEINTTFLDLFGKFSAINSNVVEKIKINTDNLLNLKNISLEFFDLNNLYYFTAIQKMLHFNSVFKTEVVIDILKKYVNQRIFCQNNNAKPDPLSIYHGISILSEYGILNSTDLINLADIKVYLESELQNFIPEKLHDNFYIFLCVKILDPKEGLAILNDRLLSPIFSLDIRTNQGIINPILDIFEHLSIIKLLDKDKDLSSFTFYLKTLKKLLKKKDTPHQSITDSSWLLLILDLLYLKEDEAKLYHNLYDFITSSTIFFDSQNSNHKFNWNSNRYLLTIELRMLFWALIASYSYTHN